MKCADCNQVMTHEEIDYYERRCESCEAKDCQRHLDWMNGKTDIELDRRYGTCDFDALH
jgi:Zn finger protein HypA/HybF involved in hydrogenase expression